MKKLNGLSFRKLFSNKKFSLPFSVILAFAIWMSITLSQKPNMERTFGDVTVSINLENTIAAENKMSIIGDISKEKFTVSVRGPSYVVSSLTKSDLNLYASAAEVDAPGEYSLKIASANNSTVSGYEILSISPSVINVSFDYMETKAFTVVALAEGASAEPGLIAEVGVVGGTETDTLTVTGPRTIVNRIDKVVALAKVNKTLSASETFDADIVIYDEAGKKISTKNLTLSETKVNVTVPISKQKVVPVVADFSNAPAGFDKSSLNAVIDHSSVTAVGTPETIDKTSLITLSPIDLTTVSVSSQSFDVSPKLPDGVRLLDSIDHFTVTVDTSAFAEKVITVSSVKYKDVATGLTAVDGSAIKNVKICGPKSVINKLNETCAYAEVYLTDKVAGTHTVTAQISFDGQNKVWAVGTYQTTVTLK